MIRNLIIIDKEDRALLSTNFGECHSLGDDNDMVSGFISAIYSFSKMFEAESVDEIRLGTLSFILMSKGSLVFALSADDEDITAHKSTLVTIIDLFEELYDYYSMSLESDIDTTIFQEFPKFLVDQDILKLNCGKFVECEGCPNSENSLPLKEMITELEPNGSRKI